ncbi:hypothetical protein cand_006320 [Cryptosporidium andersoni]|uniref:U6 small nuclear RNA (adenine-(43)-N(6))-methyltransferase n=1 Tax=Cryptosporidium andersoni TaxID=117008 RepID=A0A1J4MPP6_9CRYT|nr:hypothetical protein cand_006320 [Cryptosporidium andersoni]
MKYSQDPVYGIRLGLSRLHPRNPHRYDDFLELMSLFPSLKKYIQIKGIKVIADYSNKEFLYELTRTLMNFRYNIDWSISRGFLIPTVPSRANYVHYIADLLTPEHFYNTEVILREGNRDVNAIEGEYSEVSKSIIPLGLKVIGIDIGCGANCIYPLICHKTFGWKMFGSDLSNESINIASSIVKRNGLSKNINFLYQDNPTNILCGILDNSSLLDINFTFSMCNPPFYSSFSDYIHSTHPTRQAEGKLFEIITTGGEGVFIENMIHQSLKFPKRVIWYTTLVSKLNNLKRCRKLLLNISRQGGNEKKLEAIRTITMEQGNHIRWILAWSFYSKIDRIALLSFIRS